MACAGGPADYTLQYARRVYTAVHTDARGRMSVTLACWVCTALYECVLAGLLG